MGKPYARLRGEIGSPLYLVAWFIPARGGRTGDSVIIFILKPSFSGFLL
jgi:hypothetical protein